MEAMQIASMPLYQLGSGSHLSGNHTDGVLIFPAHFVPGVKK